MSNPTHDRTHVMFDEVSGIWEEHSGCTAPDFAGCDHPECPNVGGVKDDAELAERIASFARPGKMVPIEVYACGAGWSIARNEGQALPGAYFLNVFPALSDLEAAAGAARGLRMLRDRAEADR